MRILLTLGLSVLSLAACNSTSNPSTAPASSSSSAAPPPTATPPSAPSNTTNAGALERACAGTCAASAPLQCSKQASCVETCVQTMRMPGCEQPLLAFLACAAQQPAPRWECDEGVPTLKEGACEPEQEKVAACVGARR